MASVAHLADCASDHLCKFVDPLGREESGRRIGPRSFATYDIQGDPSVFGPLDAMAPALLDAPLTRDEVNQMFSDDVDNPFNKLRVTIQNALKELAGHVDRTGRPLDFADADLSDNTNGPWALVRACYVASNDTPNIKASKVSKMLHRKQPSFIPIIDSKLVGFYGVSKFHPTQYWTALQKDFNDNREFLDELASNVRTSEGKQVASLRVADIVIWEHVVTGCTKAN